MGVDFEVFHVSGLELRDTDRFFIQTLTFAPVKRKAALTTFLTRFTAEFPVGDRVIPYVTGGGGIGRLSEKMDFGVDFLAEGSDSFPSRDRRPGGGVRPSIVRLKLTDGQRQDSSSQRAAVSMCDSGRVWLSAARSDG